MDYNKLDLLQVQQLLSRPIVLILGFPFPCAALFLSVQLKEM